VSLWRRLFSQKPVVSCLTVTCNRVDMLHRAVECFRQQTLRDAELVIVHDHDDEATACYAKRIESATIRAVQAPPGLKLGGLRNLAVASARGQFVAQWDDDDWYAPDRLRLQLKQLKRNGRQACVLSRWTMYDTITERAFISRSRRWEGSLVAERAALGGYDESQSRGEDTPVVRALHERGQLALLDRPDLYIYVFHGANTFDRQHWELHFAGGQPLSLEETERVKSKLELAASAMPPPLPPTPAGPPARR